MDAYHLFVAATPLFITGQTKIVVTLKLGERNKSVRSAERERVASLFSKNLRGMHQVHLLANTPNETTIFGIYTDL